jgi:hypothetical protein
MATETDQRLPESLEEFDNVLVKAWYSATATVDLCQEFGLKEYQLRDRWYRLRLTGRLPRNGPRPYRQQKVAVTKHDPSEPGDDHDGRPRARSGGLDETLLARLRSQYGEDCDPLLERLCEIYGDERARA